MTIEPTSHSPTVLIIDDSEDMRQLVRHYIMVEWRGAKIEEDRKSTRLNSSHSS